MVADKKEFEFLKKHLERKFGKISMEVSDNLSYLGMQIEMKDGEVSINIFFCVEQMVKDHVGPMRASPGTKSTFVVDLESPALPEKERKATHMLVAKALY